MTSTADLSKGPVLLAISTTTEFFALSTCAVRYLICRRSKHKSRSNKEGQIHLDDWAAALAAAVSFVGAIFTIVEGSSMSKSMSVSASITDDDGRKALEFDWLGQPWYMMGTTFAKISVCLFFIRLVGTVKQWRILLASQILLMTVLNFAFSLTTNLQCRPLAKLWDPTVEGACWDPSVQLNIGYLQGAFSVFWWLFLSLFPVMIVRDLEVHQNMRWPFYFLSGLSLLAAIFATVRTYETSQTITGVFTFHTFFATVLSILEQNIGIVAANVLPVGSLFCSPRQSTVRRTKQRLISSVGGPNIVAQADNTPFETGTGLIDSPGRPGVDTIIHNDNDYDSDSDSNLIIEGPRKSSYESQQNTPPSTIQFCSQALPQDQHHNLFALKNSAEQMPKTPLRTMRDAVAVVNRGVRAIPASLPSLPRVANLPALPTLATLATLANPRGFQGSNRRRPSAGSVSLSISHPGELLESQESFWPRGIIKTVEVEVVEEDIATVPNQAIRRQNRISSASTVNNIISGIPSIPLVADIRLSRHSRMGSDSDWTSLLRAGPTPPISRGPSRQGYL